jgi:hypothetical protein
MSDNQLFQPLIPVDIGFARGESPTPTKLTGIFNYIQASNYVLESYLGNGTDYNVSDENLEKRKMIHNVASAIGQNSNLYKPVNKLGSLLHLHKFYGATNDGDTHTTGLLTPNTTYTAGNGEIEENLLVNKDITIPVSIWVDPVDTFYLKVDYTGTGTITVQGSSSATQISAEPDLEYDSIKTVEYTIPGGSFITSILIEPEDTFKIFSISLMSGSESYSYNNKFFNVAAAMPLNQDKFWVVKPPCVHAYTQSGTELCDVATCKFCIGNTYDVYVDADGISDENKKGLPVCGGDYYNYVPANLRPKDGNSARKYEPYAPASTTSFYTIQSCLMMTSRGFMSKFLPFAAYDANKYAAYDVVAKNETVLYDASADYNTVLYDIALYASGRPDMVFVSDTTGAIESDTDNRYFVIGGLYSVSEMIKDLFKYLTEQQKPSTAVYAE